MNKRNAYKCRDEYEFLKKIQKKKTQFSFFVADHLLVGKLCRNLKSDRSLLSCLKVTQSSTSKIGDAPLYNSCSLPIQVMTTGSLPTPSKCKSGRFNVAQGDENKVFRLRLRSLVCFQVRAISCHLIFEVGLKVNTNVYLDVLKSLVIPWCNRVTGRRPWVWQQDSAPAHKSKETQAWLQKECYDFEPFSHRPRSFTDLNLLDYFIWSYVENITNMTSHNTKASLITAIRRVFAELP